MPWLKRYLWALIWLLTGPGFFLTVVPLWLARLQGEGFAWQARPLQWAGIWMLVNGACLAAWCAWLFFHEGQGSPLPARPPRRFVAVGPYRYVRNPMAIGLFLVLAGEACWYRSWWVAAYGALIAVLVTVFILRVEEPDLERRFGPLYCAYKKRVRRWLPRSPRGRLDL
jgi:protein-S-isoprenylcysteine O-methyltransferase Ste14